MQLILLFLLNSLCAFGSNSHQKIVEKHFAQNGIRLQDLSIAISTSAQEGVLAQIQGDSKKIPASITKLFTAAAVLSEIPPGTKVKTKLVSDGKIIGKTLKGNLYLVGGGDPGFVSESMWNLVNTFLRNSVEKIEGDIVVDDTLFDNQRYDDSREAARVDRAYDAPVGAMSFNWNSVNIFLRPNKRANEAQAFADPENEYVVIENKLKLGSKNSFEVQRIPFDDGRDKIRIAGTISKDSNELVVYKSVTKPDLWSGYNLKSFLKQRNVSLTGKIKTGKAPTNASLLSEVESKPIESMVADMNKFSNNYVAEMLTKLLAIQKGHQGTIAAGMKVIIKSSGARGPSPSEIEIYNPSGLTRENSFSANTLHKLLESVRKDFRLFPEFISSLPIAGVDGTLKKRLSGENGTRWVRGKTGLLTGVTSLAGYAGRSNGEVLTFVMIYNGPQDGAKVRNTFDGLLLKLLE